MFMFLGGASPRRAYDVSDSFLLFFIFVGRFLPRRAGELKRGKSRLEDDKKEKIIEEDEAGRRDISDAIKTPKRKELETLGSGEEKPGFPP